MGILKRKIDKYLMEWKKTDRMPLIVKGARQIGKTFLFLIPKPFYTIYTI